MSNTIENTMDRMLLKKQIGPFPRVEEVKWNSPIYNLKHNISIFNYKHLVKCLNLHMGPTQRKKGFLKKNKAIEIINIIEIFIRTPILWACITVK